VNNIEINLIIILGNVLMGL